MGGFFIIIALFAIIGYALIVASEKELKRSIGESSEALSAEILDKIDRNINSRIQEFQAYSKTSLVQETVMQSNDAFAQLGNVQEYIDKEDKEWTGASEKEITPFMREIIDNRLSEELKRRISFYDKSNGYNVYGEIFLTNKYGANVAQTGKTSDYRQDDEEWWQIAKQDGVYIRDIDYDESANIYSIDIGIRVDDKDGNFSGVMKVVLNIEGVIDTVAKPVITEQFGTPEFRLFDAEGRVIYSNAGETFLQSLADEDFFKETMNAGRGNFMLEEPYHKDKKRLLAYSTSKGYKAFKGLNWTLLLEYDSGKILAQATQLRNNMAIVLLSVMALATALGLYISRSISKSLKSLATTIDEISKGNFKAEIAKTGNITEVGELARSFERILASLKLAILRTGAAKEELGLGEAIKAKETAEKRLESLTKFPSENPNPVMRIGRDGRLLYSNEAGIALLKRHNLKINDNAPKEFMAIIKRVFLSNKRIIVEYKAGDATYSCVFIPITEENFVNVYCFDITEKKRAEEKAEENERRFTSLTNASPDCIKLLDLKGELLYMSPGGLKEHRIKKPEDAVGWDYMGSIVKEHRIRVRKALDKAMQGVTTTLEIRHIPEKSMRTWCLMTLAPLKNKNGKVTNVFGVSRDITQQKKTEESLKKRAG